ncbi:uncharacterized protein V6R79_025844 [Siganus canaliculatus]
MGYDECYVMDSRTGSVSSGRVSGTSMKGQTLKRSPFCPHSSSKLTQSIVKDHMVSHYKKVYSAKAAIDASVPKSLIHSVKYNDQIKQGWLRKGGRPQSAQSLSQRNSRASCTSSQSGLSVQYEDSPYSCSRSSAASTPRFGLSFHTKEVVYPSSTVGSHSHFHHVRPSSEIRYQTRQATSQRKLSACSLAASGNQSCYKTFQDPVQKTYSGDLLQKHSQRFTQDKPFTPKTLKSDKSSYLSNYRYYQAPPRKPTQDCTRTKQKRQETYNGSTKMEEYTQGFYEPSQGFSTEPECSEDEFNRTHLSATRQPSRANKSRDLDFFTSSSRILSREGKSPSRKSTSAEEEELLYLKFISTVTDDMLSRGHISNKVLDRVIKRHIDMNRHQLDEGKMRHLLDVLRKDFEEPTDLSTYSAELGKTEHDMLHTFPPHLDLKEKQMDTKESNDLFSYASLLNYCDTPDNSDPLMVSTPLCSPERTVSPAKTKEMIGENDSVEKSISSPQLGQGDSDNRGTSEEDCLHIQLDTTAANEVCNENHEHTNITSEIGSAEQCEELEDLGKSLLESLHVSNNRQSNDTETAEQQADSDDDF